MTWELWSGDLGIEADENAGSKLCIETMKLAKSTKLRFFQYRLINRRLVTYFLRAKWDDTVSDRCTFCNEVPETVIHMLWECNKVKEIWKYLERWLSYMLQIPVTLNMVNVICNNIKGPWADLINTVVLIAKQYIYATKCTKADLSFLSLAQEIL